jgi:hypothetical protein
MSRLTGCRNNNQSEAIPNKFTGMGGQMIVSTARSAGGEGCCASATPASA